MHTSALFQRQAARTVHQIAVSTRALLKIANQVKTAPLHVQVLTDLEVGKLTRLLTWMQHEKGTTLILTIVARWGRLHK